MSNSRSLSVPVLIALGGNQGDVRATGGSALERLGALPDVHIDAVSRWYSTEPVGCEGRFLNAAALLSTSLGPVELLDQMLEVEAWLGRVRTGHWTPRPIDLDVVLYSDQVIAHPRLHVPHRLAWCRRFVLDPAIEIAAEMVHASTGMTLRQLQSRLVLRPLRVQERLPSGDWRAIFERLPERLQHQIVVVTSDATVTFVSSHAEAEQPFTITVMRPLDEACQMVTEALIALLDEPLEHPVAVDQLDTL